MTPDDTKKSIYEYGTTPFHQLKKFSTNVKSEAHDSHVPSNTKRTLSSTVSQRRDIPATLKHAFFSHERPQ